MRGPLCNTKIKSSQLHTHKKLKKKLIEEITLAIKDFHAAKREEWSHQLAAINLQMPLPSFVVDNQCFIVDGGQSQYPLSISLVSEVLIAKLLSREISRLWEHQQVSKKLSSTCTSCKSSEFDNSTSYVQKSARPSLILPHKSSKLTTLERLQGKKTYKIINLRSSQDIRKITRWQS